HSVRYHVPPAEDGEPARAVRAQAQAGKADTTCGEPYHGLLRGIGGQERPCRLNQKPSAVSSTPWRSGARSRGRRSASGSARPTIASCRSVWTSAKVVSDGFSAGASRTTDVSPSCRLQPRGAHGRACHSFRLRRVVAQAIRLESVGVV